MNTKERKVNERMTVLIWFILECVVDPLPLCARLPFVIDHTNSLSPHVLFYKHDSPLKFVAHSEQPPIKLVILMLSYAVLLFLSCIYITVAAVCK